MRGADFLDTNILVYAATSHPDFACIADDLITSGAVISVQVLNEFASVMSSKHRATWAEIRNFLEGARTLLTVIPLTPAAHVDALRLVERYRLQWWDALIAASALEMGCDRLLTQDMHAGLVINGKLTVVNPFA
jgi:predicted nucleic acid-binding protein